MFVYSQDFYYIFSHNVDDDDNSDDDFRSDYDEMQRLAQHLQEHRVVRVFHQLAEGVRLRLKLWRIDHVRV
jgi:hypothetical protein